MRVVIVIAGGTGFLGSPLAETYAEEGHDVRVLTRGLPPGESRHESGTGVPGITAWAGTRMDSRTVGRLHSRRRCGDQPRRRIDRRKAVDAAAQGRSCATAASLPPAAWPPRSSRPRSPRRCSSARARSATTARRRRPEDRTRSGRHRLPRPPVRGLGSRGAQGRARRHPARDHPHRPRPRDAPAARCRR